MIEPTATGGRWADALDRLGERGPFVLPEVADLDHAERRFGLRLPADYRAYCLAFGFGDFRFLQPDQPDRRDEVRVAVPGGAGDLFDYDPIGLAYQLLGCSYGAGPAVFAREFDRGDVARRLVFFARHELEFFGWDPAEMTDPAGPEYAIYAIGRPNRLRVVRVGDSFARFVRDDLLRGLLDAPGRPPLEFRQAAREAP